MPPRKVYQNDCPRDPKSRFCTIMFNIFMVNMVAELGTAQQNTGRHSCFCAVEVIYRVKCYAIYGQ